MNKYLLILCLSALSTMAFSNDYQIKLLVGDQVEEIRPFLAQLRLAQFHEYPYLYEGTLEGEYAYSKEMMSYKHCAVVVAYVQDKPVGIITGSSLVNFCDIFCAADEFKAANLDPKGFYYFAEAIVIPEYRGKKLFMQLFSQFEAWVVAQGYTHGCFVSEAYDNHPLKPHDYKELDPLWRLLGYEKTNITVTYGWSTIQPDGSSRMQDHVMPYWIKRFE